jgi:putative ABC transport system substrate-binding protein
VASLAHPGGNVTGIGILVDLLTEKNVQLFKQAVPDLGRIAALCNAPDPFSKIFLDTSAALAIP